MQAQTLPKKSRRAYDSEGAARSQDRWRVRPGEIASAKLAVPCCGSQSADTRSRQAQPARRQIHPARCIRRRMVSAMPPGARPIVRADTDTTTDGSCRIRASGHGVGGETSRRLLARLDIVVSGDLFSGISSVGRGDCAENGSCGLLARDVSDRCRKPAASAHIAVASFNAM
jgi:hypothetical protein